MMNQFSSWKIVRIIRKFAQEALAQEARLQQQQLAHAELVTVWFLAMPTCGALDSGEGIGIDEAWLRPENFDSSGCQVRSLGALTRDILKSADPSLGQPL